MTRKSYAAFILVSNTIPPSKTSCVLMQVPTTQTITFRSALGGTWNKSISDMHKLLILLLGIIVTLPFLDR